MNEKAELLIVDDNHANLLAMEALFDANDYTLVNASSGKQALALLDQHDFAAIVLDVQMPVMDGYETARRIKAHPRGRDVPIVFVTAVYKEDEDMRRGYESGGIDYLAKPLATEVIKTKVRIYVDLYRKTRELGQNKKLVSQVRERFLADRKLETVLDAISDGVLLAEADGKLTHANKEARRILGGKTPAPAESMEAISACWADNERRLAPDEWALTKALRTAATARNTALDIRCVDGTEKSVVNSALPIKDDRGTVVGIACVIRELPRSDQ